MVHCTYFINLRNRQTNPFPAREHLESVGLKDAKTGNTEAWRQLVIVPLDSLETTTLREGDYPDEVMEVEMRVRIPSPSKASRMSGYIPAGTNAKVL